MVGPTNSGKSTLAQRLAAALDAPRVELDALYWRPEWTPAPDEEFQAAILDATAGERWVVAGNYHRTAQPITWPRAALVIWLDLPLRVILPRLIRRSWRRWRTRELLWGTNTEQFWRHLMLWDKEQSLIAWQLSTHRRNRARNEAEMRDQRWSHLRFVRLRSPREIEAFARAFEAAALVSAGQHPG